VGDHQHFAASSGAAGGGADPSQGRLVGWPSSRDHITSPAGAHAHNFTTGFVSNDHAHGFSGTTAATGSSNSHTHTLDLAVQYVDLIICTKS
jgi:hypothetical protein